jgi:CHASE1-domain containing sensor protein
MQVASLHYAPRVEHRFRSALEVRNREWMAEAHGQVLYQGITATNWTDEGPVQFSVPERPIYFPISRLEPFEGNEKVYDDDIYYASSALIDSVLSTGKPSLSAPLQLSQDSSGAFSVFLTHPGARTSVKTESLHSIVAMTIRIPDLLVASCSNLRASKDVYLYDSTEDEMLFLGAAQVMENGDDHSIFELDETDYEDIDVSRKAFMSETTIDVMDRRWTVVVVPHDSTRAVPVFVVLGGLFIFLVFIACAVVLSNYLFRIDSISRIKSNAQIEKANVYHQQMQRERRLNEYLA